MWKLYEARELSQSNQSTNILMQLYIGIVSGSILYQLVPGIVLTFVFALLVDFYNEVTTYLEN